MRTADKDRCKLIVELIDKKRWSMQKVADKLGLRSRSTIHETYWREKKGVRRLRSKLSTGKGLRVRK